MFPGLYVRQVYGLHAAVRDTTPEAARAFFDARTSLGPQPTLTEVAETAAFLVSDRASALTGTIVNLSCGSIVDWPGPPCLRRGLSGPCGGRRAAGRAARC
jgi:NAD(P)-dependent dehydrogenase (short-subunit alcohol dehydrogenase family)